MLKTKKIISMILTVCMLMSLVPTVAFASDASVAQVGDQYYASLQDAINAASEGDTVYLTNDVTVSQKIVIAKSINLYGNGNTLTYTGIDRAITIDASSKKYDVDIVNLKIIADSAQRGINYNNGGSLYLESVVFETSGINDRATYAVNLPGSSDGANVMIENCVLEGLIALSIWGEGVTVDAINSTFNSLDFSSSEDYAAIMLNDDGETAAENTAVTLENCTVNATTQTGAKSYAIFNATKTGKVYYDDKTNEINGTVYAPVAIVRYDNDQQYYCTTLQEAIDAAIEDNKPVEIINNIIETEIITIAGGVVINGNGYKLTSSAGRAINIDTTAEVTINDLVIEAENGCQRGVNIINKAGTTNLNNVTVYGETHYAVHVATSAGAAVVNVNGCNLTGYGAVAVYGDGSKVSVQDSNLYGKNIYQKTDSNDFATIAAGGDDISITVSAGMVVAESTEGLALESIVCVDEGACNNLKVILNTELKTIGTATLINVTPQDKNNVLFRNEYKNALLAEGYATTAPDAMGLIAIDYDKEIYTVTYVVDEKTVSTVLVQEGDALELIAVPEKEGYTAKWDNDGKNITADTVITAVYTKIEVEEPKEEEPKEEEPKEEEPKEDAEGEAGEAIPQPEVEIVDTKEVFNDVKAEGWYKEYVDYAYSHKLLIGVGEKDFGLDQTLTRGMFVTVLARIHGIETTDAANKDAKAVFNDVKAGMFYSKAVEWAKENNIVAGYPDNTFRANDGVTREELCKMLINYVEFAKVTLKADKEATAFADADAISTWAKDAVTACQKAGIVNGYKQGDTFTFKPAGLATRAEGSKILACFHSEYVA